MHRFWDICNATCNYTVTLKSGLGVIQGHRSRHGSIRRLCSYWWSTATTGLSRTISEINGDFSRKSQICSTPVYFAPPLEVFRAVGIGYMSQLFYVYLIMSCFFQQINMNERMNEWMNEYRRLGSKTRMMGLRPTGSTKKCDDIFSRLDTIHERDRRTDGQTSGDSKDLLTHSVSCMVKIKLAYFYERA